MKRILIAITLALVLTITTVTAVFAATWEFRFPISVTDNSSASRTYYPVLLGFDTDGISTYINDNGLDTEMMIGATVIKYMLSTDNVTAVIPNFPASSKVTMNLYTGYAPEQTAFDIVVGYGGYITTSDNTTLEPGDNCTITLPDTILNGDSCNITSKGTDFLLSYDGTDVSATISGSESEEFSYGNQNNQRSIYGVILGAQSFTTVGSFDISSVDIRANKNGSPGTIYVSIRASDGTNPTGGDLVSGSFNGNDIAAGALYYNAAFSTPYTLSAATKYHIVVSAPDGDAGNNLLWLLDTAGSFANGDASLYNGAAWTNYSAQDHDFKVYSTYNPTVAVTAAAGEHDITVTLDGVDLELDVDGDTDSVSLGGESIADNANNWIWGGSGVSAFGSIELTVGGNQQLYYAPNAIISGTTMPDRATATVNNGVITWGSNTGLNITYGEMVSYASTDAATGTSDTGGADMPTSSMPATWFAMGENVEDLPFYGMVYNVADQLGYSDTDEGVQAIYLIIIFGFALMAFLLLARFTRSNFLAVTAMLAVLLVGSSMTVIPMWIVFCAALVCYGLLYLQGQMR